MKTNILLVLILGLLTASAFSVNLPLIRIIKATSSAQTIKEYCNNQYSCGPINVEGSTEKTATIKWTCTDSSTINTTVTTLSKLNIDCEKAFTVGGHSEEEFPKPDAPKRTSDNYAYSYKTMTMSSKPNAFKSWVGEKCIQVLRDFYASGKKLSSEVLEKHIKTSSEIRGTFYHYTNAKVMKLIGKKNRPLDIFDYSRNSVSTTPWKSPFYMADDTVSSAEYGNILLKITMRPNFKVLYEDDYPDAMTLQSLDAIVVRDLIEQEPELETCKLSDPYRDQSNIPLYFLTAEEMGVDMIHYSWHSGQRHWFQVINPFAIDHIENYSGRIFKKPSY
jgi:hypothetical protein